MVKEMGEIWFWVRIRVRLNNDIVNMVKEGVKIRFWVRIKIRLST